MFKKKEYDFGYLFTESCEATSMVSLTTEINALISRYNDNYELRDIKFNSVGTGGNIMHHYALLTFKKINK